MPKTRIQNLSEFISSHRLLFIILIITFVVRLPSLFEPLWYGDEAIYLTIGQKLLHGGLLYVDIFDHKTPGIYYLAAFAIKTLGPAVWSFRIILMVWMLSSLFVFYFLAKKMFDKKAAVLAVLFLAFLTSTPLLEGNITNSELLMILPICLAIIAGLGQRYFLSGIFFSLAVLLKAPAIFDFGAFFLLIIFSTKSLDLRPSIRNLLFLTAGFLTPIAVSAVYFSLHGALIEYFKSAFLFNISYTSYKNSFLFSNGLLVLKALPVLALVVYFALRVVNRLKKGESNNFSYFDFLLLWLSFSFYAAVFGGRPYNHYLIQVIPAFSLLIAYCFSQSAKRMLGSLVLFLVIVLTFFLNFTPNISPSYYPSFFEYVTGRISFSTYADSFDKKTSRNYALAGFLKSTSPPGSSVYLFSNQSPIYFLSSLDPASRYITFFHIAGDKKAKDEAGMEISQHKPYYILAENPPPGSFPQLEKILSEDYNLLAFYQNAAIYKITGLDKKSAF